MLYRSKFHTFILFFLPRCIIRTFDGMTQTSPIQIGVLGCGWLGLPLARRLAESGYRVTGSTTRTAQFEVLRASGIQPVLFDFSNSPVAEAEALFQAEWLIIAVPPSGIELNKLKDLLKSAKQGPLRQIILISSTGIYRDTNSLITEEDLTALDTTSKLFAIEELITSFPELNPVILRMAGLMGYDRQPVRYGQSPKVRANPNGRTNMIHRDDAIEIVQRVISKTCSATTFNCCADEHPTKREFYTRLAQQNGLEPPVFDLVRNDSFKLISNKKVKEALVFQFQDLYASLG